MDRHCSGKKAWIFYSGSFWRKKGFPEIGNFGDSGIEIGIAGLKSEFENCFRGSG